MPPVIASITPSTAQVAKPGDTGFTLIVRGAGFTASSQTNFGGSGLKSVFIDANTLSTQVTPDNYSSFSLGGLSVTVEDGTDVSNPASFTVTANSPIKVSDLQAITDAITIPSVTNLLKTGSPFVNAVPFVQVYRIVRGDTIQGIAQRISGGAAQWHDIAFINNLRYPFVSEDQKVLQGQNNYGLILSKRINVGDTTVFINGANPFVTQDAILYFSLSSPLSDGTLKTISDVIGIAKVEVDIVNPANTKVSLKTPIFNVYEAGTTVDVLTTSNNTTSRVVTIGDFILVPVPNGSESFVQSEKIDASNAYAILGQDIALDDFGLLNPDSNGDLSIFSGLDNLHQAISHRLLTETNELNYHPTYGNSLLQYVGHVVSPTLLVLANFEIERVLLDDPRVNSIKTISTTIKDDSLSVRALIDVDIFNSVTEFNFVIPTIK